MTPDAIVAIPALAVSAAVIGHAWWATHKHPARQDGPEPLPERGIKPCSVSNCRQPATTIIRAGFDNWPVCGRCREELAALRGEAS